VPRVAVIVPCFNAGRLVLEAVASVDEPEPVELIVVDDDSTDASTQDALAELELRGVRVLR
jgi:glycosyltransferase involved in cell wall biosynthesis